MIVRLGSQRDSVLSNFQIQVCANRELLSTRLTFSRFIDSAASAVRNLNDYEIMNRKLRVDFSNDGGEEETVSRSFLCSIHFLISYSNLRLLPIDLRLLRMVSLPLH